MKKKYFMALLLLFSVIITGTTGCGKEKNTGVEVEGEIIPCTCNGIMKPFAGEGIFPIEQIEKVKVIELKDLQTQLYFSTHNDPYELVTFGEGMYYVIVNKAVILEYQIKNAVGDQILFTYLCMICNFPDYATLWEIPKTGIDIIISGKVYVVSEDTRESSKGILGVFELTSLKIKEQLKNKEQ